MPNTREKLIELLYNFYLDYNGYICDGCGTQVAEQVCGTIADHLIANGVTVNIKKEKPPTDLTGKCGSCAYASIEAKEHWLTTPSYLRCINPTKRWYRDSAQYKARTTKACKLYKAKDGA